MAKYAFLVSFFICLFFICFFCFCYNSKVGGVVFVVVLFVILIIIYLLMEKDRYCLDQMFLSFSSVGIRRSCTLLHRDTLPSP